MDSGTGSWGPWNPWNPDKYVTLPVPQFPRLLNEENNSNYLTELSWEWHDWTWWTSHKVGAVEASAFINSCSQVKGTLLLLSVAQLLHHFLLTLNRQTNKWANREFSSELGQRVNAKLVLKRERESSCPRCGCKGDTSLEWVQDSGVMGSRWEGQQWGDGVWQREHRIGGGGLPLTTPASLSSTLLTCQVIRWDTELCSISEIRWF